MKLPYMKPEFGQILLEEGNVPTHCSIGVNHEWLACGIPIEDMTRVGGAPSVIFSSKEYGCNTKFQDGAYICYWNGANYQVFGS